MFVADVGWAQNSKKNELLHIVRPPMLISTIHIGQSLFRLLPRTPAAPNPGSLE
jgi:hypothetical protein